MSRKRHSLQWRIFVVAFCVIGGTSAAQAETLYVDNRIGNDVLDGTAERLLDDVSGPVKSIRRALLLAHPGDSIVIANHGIPYYETISMIGGKHDAVFNAPFQIIGNGAIIDGTNEVPAFAWKLVGPSLWKMTPVRKGFYQLVQNDQPIPEIKNVTSQNDLIEMPEGHWSAWKGAIYYQAAVLDDPRQMNLRFASRSVGLSLIRVRGVFITGLTLRNFRLDGVNAHDLCRDVVLKDVVMQGNGRFGLYAGGTSQALLIGGEISRNRKDQIIVAGKAGVEVVNTVIDESGQSDATLPTAPKETNAEQPAEEN